MKMYCLFLLLGASALEVQENPIRRIVNLLQATQKKIEKEGEEQEDMFEKYMCSHGRARDRSSARCIALVPCVLIAELTRVFDEGEVHLT